MSRLSRYSNDPRVTWPGLGWPRDVVVLIPDPAAVDNDRVVMDVDGGYVVAVNGDTGYDLQRRMVWPTVDDAIAAVIGKPRS